MSSNEPVTQFDGPYVREDAYNITVAGRRVPHIEAYLVPGTEDTWTLFVDRRFYSDPLTGDEIRRFLPVMAQAMAVAAGYPHFGATSRERPFAPILSGIVPAGDDTFAPTDDDWTLPQDEETTP